MAKIFINLILYWILLEITKVNSDHHNAVSGHPLDPLTSEEISDTVSVLLDTYPFIGTTGNWAFNWITLKEPEKVLLLDYFLNGKRPPFNSVKIPRKSFVVLVEREENIVVEVVVNLRARKVESWKRLKLGTQAPFRKKGKDGEQIAKEDERVKQRCREMGWWNMSLVRGEPWAVAYGENKPYLVNATRPMIVYFYGMLFENDNHYAHPFDFTVTVDIAKNQVLAIDNLPIHSNYDSKNRFGDICPKMAANYEPRFRTNINQRKDVHPIYMEQPDGVSYILNGTNGIELTWQNFKMQLGYNGREGPIIHHLGYQDGSTWRPLFYRMAISETFVAYGDPRPPFHQKMPFDMGQFTLGFSAIDHKQEKICKGAGGKAAYFSVYLNSVKGEPILCPNVLCIYEEDSGILWAHTIRKNKVIHSRSQRLVIVCMINEGNYDYKFSWRFYEDGTIEFNTELHGSLHTQMMAKGVTDTGGFGTIVHPQVNAQFHQHFIGLRLDAEIDGNVNTVSTIDLVPAKQQQQSKGYSISETLLRTPAEARTKTSPMTGRTWEIGNPESIHPNTGHPAAWKLIPFNSPPLFIRNDSPLHYRCAWAKYNVWVMKYKEDQLYAGGFYLNGNDLPEWLREDPNADLTQTDTVLFYVLGFTHIPRTEDFPLLSVESTGFHLKPSNFFNKNPAFQDTGYFE